MFIIIIAGVFYFLQSKEGKENQIQSSTVSQTKTTTTKTSEIQSTSSPTPSPSPSSSTQSGSKLCYGGGGLGASGSNGSDGDDGTNGSSGSNGSSGRDGTNGIDGTDGIDGIDGADGATGPAGPPGPQGPAGDSYNPYDDIYYYNWHAVGEELSGSWSDVNHWADGMHGIPGSSDNAYFGTYGFAAGTYTITVNSSAACKGLYVSVYTGHTVTFDITNNFTIENFFGYTEVGDIIINLQGSLEIAQDMYGQNQINIDAGTLTVTDIIHHSYIDISNEGSVTAASLVVSQINLDGGTVTVTGDSPDTDTSFGGIFHIYDGSLSVTDSEFIGGGHLYLYGGSATFSSNTFEMNGNLFMEGGTFSASDVATLNIPWLYIALNDDSVAEFTLESGQTLGYPTYGGTELEVGGQLTTSNADGTFTNDGGTATFASFLLGNGSGNIGRYIQNSGSTTTNSDTYIGYSAGSTGIYTQYDGSFDTAEDVFVGTYGNGTLNISDGTFESATITVAYGANSNSTVNQSGGTITNSGLLSMAGSSGADATYTMTGGRLDTGTIYMGWGTSTAELTQSGTSDVNVTGDLYLGHQAGSNASYSISGGTLDVSSKIYVGNSGNAVFTQSGTSDVNIIGNVYLGHQTGSSGDYSITNGTLDVDGNMYVGNDGSSTFTQSGTAAVTITPSPLAGRLYLGYGIGSSGDYILHGGTLTTRGIYMAYGSDASSTFTQNGGTVITDWLDLSWDVGSTAGYTLNNGTLDIASWMAVGDWDIATFTQNNGDVSVDGELEIGAWVAEADGTYTLNDGTLAANLIGVGEDGDGIFNQNGGTVTVTGDLDVGYIYWDSSEAGGTGEYNMNAGELTANNINIGGEGNVSGTLAVSGGTVTTKSLIVGVDGDGIFTQDGGNVKITGNSAGNNKILVAQLGASTGAYNLNGGLVEADQIDFYGGSASDFTMTGGTLMVDKFGDSDLSHNQDIAQSGGTIAPGDSINGSSPIPEAGIGKTTIYGNYIQSVAGKIVFDVDLTSLNLNPQAGVDYDQVYVQDDYTRSAGTYEIRFSGDIANLDANNHYYLLRADDVTNDTQYWQQYFTFYLNDIPFTPDGWVVERVAGGSEELDLHWTGTNPKSTTGPSPQSLDAEIWTDISAELTLSVDYASVVLTTGGNGLGDFLDGITGGIITGNHTWTVKSNNSTGYTLKLKEKDSLGNNGAMVNQADGSYKFSPISNSSPGAWPSLSAGETGFGYSASGKTGQANTYSNGFGSINDYVKVTTSDYEIMNSDEESALSGDTVRLNWKAQFVTGGGKFLKTGTYKEFITVTAATK